MNDHSEVIRFNSFKMVFVKQQSLWSMDYDSSDESELYYYYYRYRRNRIQRRISVHPYIERNLNSRLFTPAKEFQILTTLFFCFFFGGGGG